MSTTLVESAKDAITLAKAIDFVPGRPHVATIWRWATKGVRGQRLATVIVGGRRMVTPQALEEFLAALNAGTPAAKNHADADMARRAKEADWALESLGC